MFFQMPGRCFNHPKITGCAKVKQSDFSAVYDEFHQKILRYVRRMVGEHDAEDLAQTVSEKVHRKLAD